MVCAFLFFIPWNTIFWIYHACCSGLPISGSCCPKIIRWRLFTPNSGSKPICSNLSSQGSLADSLKPDPLDPAPDSHTAPASVWLLPAESCTLIGGSNEQPCAWTQSRSLGPRGICAWFLTPSLYCTPSLLAIGLPEPTRRLAPGTFRNLLQAREVLGWVLGESCCFFPSAV